MLRSAGFQSAPESQFLHLKSGEIMSALSTAGGGVITMSTRTVQEPQWLGSICNCMESCKARESALELRVLGAVSATVPSSLTAL